MTIRKANHQDISNISALILTLAEKYILPNCTIEGGKSLLASMTSTSIKGSFNESYQYHISEDKGCLTGVVGMKNNSHLYHLFVSDSHQGQGLSRKLWEHARDQCLQKGNNGFFTVNSALNATNIYLKLGFTPAGEIRETSGIKDIPMQIYC